MSKVTVTEDYLMDIADAIRGKLSSSSTYTPGQMAAAIESIPTGGITPTGTINITQNGTADVTQYASAAVNVPNSYAAGDEGKVVQNGALVAQSSETVTQNGTYDTTTNDEVVVSVAPNLQSKTVTENGTVTPDHGYDGLSSVVVNVSGGGGIPWNENILCNWDFNNIVNTRGALSYSSGYGFDGWSVYQGTVALGQGGIYLRKDTGKSFMLSGQFLSASAAVQALFGNVLTISALVDDQFGAYTFKASTSGGQDQGHLTVNGIDFYFYRDSPTQMPFYMFSGSNDNDNKLIRAVKVEFGTAQTLARQVNGVWTLNKTGLQNEEYFRVRAMVKNS